MEQQATTPQDVAQPSFDDKIAAKFGYGEEPESQEQPEPEAPAEDDAAPTEGDEVPVEEESQPEEPATPQDFVEIKHNGQIKRISKEQGVALMQKGFDYESGQVENKAERHRLQGLATALQRQQALAAQAIESIAEAKAYERMLAPYQSIDWVKESDADPIGTFQKRQAYDQLVSGYQAAMQQAQQVANGHTQVTQQIDRTIVEAEQRAVLDKVPQWRDRKVYDREWPEIYRIASENLKPETLRVMDTALQTDHGISVLLRDAYKYRAAVAAAKSRKGQQAPPVPKPGVPTGKITKAEAVGGIVKELHQAKDPQRKKALFDKALEAKFGLK